MDLIPILGISVWLIAKIFVMVAISVYLVFALVVVKQVGLMTETLEVGYEGLMKAISYLHLGFAILIFVVALVTL